MRLLAVSLALALAGCSTVPVIEQVREVPPPTLLAPCPVPTREIRTNGDLAAWAIDLEGALGLCNNQLDALREWAKED